MVNKETKKITVEEVTNGLFSSCNCCNASTNEASAVRLHSKKVDKIYKIGFGNGPSIVVTACEDCLKQLIGEITVALNGNAKEKDKLNSVKEYCKNQISGFEKYSEECPASETHDCVVTIEAYNDVLALIHSLEQ